MYSVFCPVVTHPLEKTSYLLHLLVSFLYLASLILLPDGAVWSTSEVPTVSA